MKTPKFVTVATLALLASPSVYADSLAQQGPAHKHDMPMSDNDAQMQMMKNRAATANTPAERNKLMSENMAEMKTHMASMKAMMSEGSMIPKGKGPMAMDPAHMQKMQQHMQMIHQMMEKLMLQQQLMMKPEE